MNQSIMMVIRNVKRTGILILALVWAQGSILSAQSVGINDDGTAPDTNAILDVKSANKGFLPPRVELNDASMAAPLSGTTKGMIIFNEGGNEPDGLYIWEGSKWLKLHDLAGAQLGEMQYWNDTTWVTIPPGNEGATLTLVNGVPTWTGGTPSIPTVTNPVTGEIWMDRNLGASQVATSSIDLEAFGDLYQWGRLTDGHQIRTSDTTAVLSSTDVPGHDDFIGVADFPNDWRSPQNNNLWQGVSGINNPCPAGFRLPTQEEWEAERLSWSSNDAAGAFASPLKLPAAGARFYIGGELLGLGTNGSYWSSTVDGSNAISLNFSSSEAENDPVRRAFGSCVRCIKD